jgi:general secretion pathway protein G
MLRSFLTSLTPNYSAPINLIRPPGESIMQSSTPSSAPTAIQSGKSNPRTHPPTPPSEGKSDGMPRRQAGFTLIEIMAVVVIMGMLMATLAVGIAGQLDNAQKKNAAAQIIRIEQALEFYKLDNRRFPTTDQGLDALISQPSSPPVPKDYNPAGYIKPDAIEDPWGADFQYRVPGENNPYTFDIWSLGPDGTEGGDDIRNWESDTDS